MAESGSELGRRQLLRGLGGLAVAGPALDRPKTAAALVTTPGEAGAPAPEQLHLQFGAEAAHEMAVSWAAPQRVRRPVVRLGRPGHGLGTAVHAEERVYTEALTGETVFTYHAVLPRLSAGTRRPYGFAAFDFDPHAPGGHTEIAVTHYGADLGSADYQELDRFVLRKRPKHPHLG